MRGSRDEEEAAQNAALERWTRLLRRFSTLCRRRGPTAGRPLAVHAVVLPEMPADSEAKGETFSELEIYIAYALEGEWVSLPEAPLLYLRPCGGRWRLEPAPGSDVLRARVFEPSKAVGAPLPPSGLMLREEGLLIRAAPARRRLAIFPGSNWDPARLQRLLS